VRVERWLVCLVGIGAGVPGVARAQAIAWFDDFACDDDDRFGEGRDHGWYNLYPSDPWTTAAGDGVGPVTDDQSGGVGAPIDDVENFLLTGSALWEDYSLLTTITNPDDDWVGLVLRVSSADAYYRCGYWRNSRPGCEAPAPSAPGFALQRINSDDPCRDDAEVDAAPGFAPEVGATYAMALGVVGGTVFCQLDADQNGLGNGADVELSYIDPEPLPPGPGGLAAYNNGGARFQSALVVTFDPDSDADGLPDAVEAATGTDPAAPDTDADGLTDPVELGLPDAPWDTDRDGLLDAWDLDSDGDGAPDAHEHTGGVSPDSDCDGFPDVQDADSAPSGPGDTGGATGPGDTGSAADDGATDGPATAGAAAPPAAWFCAQGGAGGALAAPTALALGALRRRRRSVRRG
jgi:hypothetical protein